MTYSKLERFEKSQCLVNAATNGEIVHSLLTSELRDKYHRFAADEEKEYRKIPVGSIMKRPRRAMPSSSIRTP